MKLGNQHYNQEPNLGRPKGNSDGAAAVEARPVRVQGLLRSHHQRSNQGQPDKGQHHDGNSVLLIASNKREQPVESHDGHAKRRRHEGLNTPLLRKLLNHRQVPMYAEQTVDGHKQGCGVPDGVVCVTGLRLQLLPRPVQPVEHVNAGRDDGQDDDADSADVKGVAFRE